MQISSEFWLLLAAIGLYLADQLVLLGRSQIILVRGAGSWHGVAATGFWKLAGKSLHWVGPLMPWRLAFHLHWQADTAVMYRPAGLEEILLHLAPLRVGATVLWLLLFMVMPVTAVMVGLGSVFLAELVAAYSLAIGMVVWLGKYRHLFGLTQQAYRSMASDVLLCLPFAINLPNRVSRAIWVNDDALSFALLHMDTQARSEFLHSLRQVVDEWLDFAPDDSESWRNAQTYSTLLQQCIEVAEEERGQR